MLAVPFTSILSSEQTVIFKTNRFHRFKEMACALLRE